MSLKLGINYSEYECGHPCTPDGCRGHQSSIPDTITINGFDLHLDGFDPETDDFPFRSESAVAGTDEFDSGHDLKAWKEMVAELQRRLAPQKDIEQKIDAAVVAIAKSSMVAPDRVALLVWRNTVVNLLRDLGID